MDIASTAGRLEGRIAVVTGAGSGIGLAIAGGLAAAGARVLAVDRAVSDDLTALAARETEVTTAQADVTDESAVDRIFEHTSAELGEPEVLVHCAAVQLVGEDSFVGGLELSAWQQTLEVNLTGTFLVCRAAVRAMLAAGKGGSIILCGSPTSLRGSSASFSAYSSSKGGVHALARVLATAYGGHGIRANTLVPGPTETNLTRELFADEVLREQLTAKVPLGRLGRPEDYVGAALFLASEESAFVTGSELVVDGGYVIA